MPEQAFGTFLGLMDAAKRGNAAGAMWGGTAEPGGRWCPIQAPIKISCVTLGRSLNLSGPQSPHLWNPNIGGDPLSFQVQTRSIQVPFVQIVENLVPSQDFCEFPGWGGGLSFVVSSI